MENQTFEPLEIPKIPIIYCNDPFLRARKRLGSHVELSKRASGAEGRSGSPPISIEVIAAREAAEKVQEEVEEEDEGHKAPIVRKSKRLAKKAKVVIPASPKRKKGLPKLAEVPWERRKFLDASTTTAAKVNPPHPLVAEIAKLVVVSTMEA